MLKAQDLKVEALLGFEVHGLGFFKGWGFGSPRLRYTAGFFVSGWIRV